MSQTQSILLRACWLMNETELIETKYHKIALETEGYDGHKHT